MKYEALCFLNVCVVFFKHKVRHLKRMFCPQLEMMKLVTSAKRMQQCFWSESECLTKMVPAEIRKCRP